MVGQQVLKQVAQLVLEHSLAQLPVVAERPMLLVVPQREVRAALVQGVILMQPPPPGKTEARELLVVTEDLLPHSFIIYSVLLVLLHRLVLALPGFRMVVVVQALKAPFQQLSPEEMAHPVLSSSKNFID
jgi:hypothetical protein